MAFLQKVRLMIRFNRCGKWVMKPAMWSDNKRHLLPRRAKGMSQAIAGEYMYYLRYYSPRLRKRLYESVGKDSVMAVADANTRDIELITTARGLAIIKDPGAVPPRLRVEIAIHSYLAAFHKQRTTLLAYRRALGIFREACDCTYVDEISVGCVRRYLARLSKEFYQDTTYHRYHYVEFFLRKHGKAGLLPKSERPKKRKRSKDGTDIQVYSDADVKKLLAACESEGDRFLILLAAEAGLRKGEIAHLEKEDIRDGQIVVREKLELFGWKPKNGTARTVDVPRSLTDALRKWMATLPTTLLFPTDEHTPNRHLEGRINALAAKAGVSIPVTLGGERQPMHALRAYFAIRRLQQGHDVNTVRDWMGHADFDTLLIYLKKARSLSDDARKKLDEGAL
ncbi:MAG: site-specific integrase [Candidatus Acidiferrales bacterium]